MTTYMIHCLGVTVHPHTVERMLSLVVTMWTQSMVHIHFQHWDIDHTQPQTWNWQQRILLLNFSSLLSLVLHTTHTSHPSNGVNQITKIFLTLDILMFFSTSQFCSSGSGNSYIKLLLYSASVGFGFGIVFWRWQIYIYIFKFIILCTYTNINF